MSRRVSLPGADELFRSTQSPRTDDPEAENARPADGVEEPVNTEEVGADDAAADERRVPSGRIRHDEKITVYVTSDELLDLERTRLVLRGDHRLAVDRGRIVREAIHLALEGVKDDGEASALVRRLREQ